MIKEYAVQGENVEGEFIQFGFEGTLEDCIRECELALQDLDGGHLDIFIIHDDHDEFVGDVEV